MTKTSGPVAAVARAATFHKVEIGPNGTLVLGLVSTEGPEAFVIDQENGVQFAAELLAAAGSDEMASWAFPVTGLRAALSSEGTMLVELSLGTGRLPISLQAEEVEQLQTLLEKALARLPSDRSAQH